MSAYRRLEAEIEAAKRIAMQREFQLERIYQAQILERQNTYLRLRQAEKIRAEQQYDEYQLRRAKQHILAQEQAIQQRLLRQTASRNYSAKIQSERLATEARDRSLQNEQRLAEQAAIRKAQLHAASILNELQRKQQLKTNIDKSNLAILEQQKIQQKFQKQLNDLQLKIGIIYDQRQQRKKKQVNQLQILDQKNFKIQLAMTSSKVQQKAIEESLASLSTLIVI